MTDPRFTTARTARFGTPRSRGANCLRWSAAGATGSSLSGWLGALAARAAEDPIAGGRASCCGCPAGQARPTRSI